MKVTPSQRTGTVEMRTVDKLKRDHDRFIASGGNIKNAMFYNNAILPVFFNIPLDQVIQNSQPSPTTKPLTKLIGVYPRATH